MSRPLPSQAPTEDGPSDYLEYLIRHECRAFHSQVMATLVTGTFVLYDDESETKVGRLTVYVPSRMVWKVEEYVFKNRRSTAFHPKLGYYINTRASEFPQRLLREVANPCWPTEEIAEEKITDIAFVFSSFNLKDPKYSWAGGIKNAFYISTIARDEETVVSVNGKRDVLTQFRPLEKEDGHVPFPDESFAGSYSEQIWFGLGSIHETVQRGLNRYGHSQPLHFNIGISFPNDACIRYIAKKSLEHVLLTRIPNKSSGVVTFSGFKKQRVIGDHAHYSFFRYETEAALVCFRQIFGVSVTEGIRSRPPSLKGHPRGKQFDENCFLHYIKGGATVEDPYVGRTKRRGIDIRFDGYNKLKISGRFKKWLFSTDNNQRPIGLPSLHVQQMLFHFREQYAPIVINEYDSSNSVDDEDLSVESDDISVAASDTTEDTLHSLIQPENMFHLNGAGNVYEIVAVVDQSVSYRLVNDHASAISTISTLNPDFREGIRSYNGFDADI
jgi:hypothetical protein